MYVFILSRDLASGKAMALNSMNLMVYETTNWTWISKLTMTYKQLKRMSLSDLWCLPISCAWLKMPPYKVNVRAMVRITVTYQSAVSTWPTHMAITDLVVRTRMAGCVSVTINSKPIKVNLYYWLLPALIIPSTYYWYYKMPKCFHQINTQHLQTLRKKVEVRGDEKKSRMLSLCSWHQPDVPG